MSNGFIYVVDAHVIDKIEENKYPDSACALHAECSVKYFFNLSVEFSCLNIVEYKD